MKPEEQARCEIDPRLGDSANLGALRSVANCAYCADYACSKSQRYLGFAPQMQTAPDELRLSLWR